MAETIDDKINANLPQQKKEEEKKPVSVLGSALEEIVQGVGTATNLAVAGGLPLIADRGIGNFKGMGGFGATATSAGLYFGSNDRSSKSARNKSLIGTLFALFAKYTFTPISALNVYARAALIPAWQAVANAYYILTDHIIEKKTFSGIVKNFKDNYKQITKDTIKYLSIPALITTFLPIPLQIPALALQAYVFKKVVAPDKKTEPKDKIPYYVAAYSGLSKLANALFWAPLRGAEYIGSSLRTMYDKMPAQQLQPAPARATSPQPKPA